MPEQTETILAAITFATLFIFVALPAIGSLFCIGETYKEKIASGAILVFAAVAGAVPIALLIWSGSVLISALP